MIVPTRRFFHLILAATPAALLPVFVGPAGLGLWLALLAGLLLAFGLDAILAPSPGSVGVTMDLPRELYVGDESAVAIGFSCARGRPRDLELVIETSPGIDAVEPIRPAVGEAGETIAVECPLRPNRRGTQAVERLHWRFSGPLGLCERRRIDEVQREIAVVPNLRLVRETALAFATRPEFLAGMKADRLLGDGSEFDRMREFVPGMDTRAIDWKATARHRRLMARQYRAERNHLVVTSIDTGRLMGEPLGGLARLDHAVNAALLLAWSCLKTGDRVGLHAFDERSRKYVEADGGIRALQRIRSATADLSYGQVETNYTLGITELSLQLRRRAMIVVFTEFADSITAEIMVENLGRLARRHLVLFVSLRDRFLDESADMEPGDLDGVGRAVVTRELVRERQVVQMKLRRAGVHVLDVLPEELSTRLVQTYLDMKNRELI